MKHQVEYEVEYTVTREVGEGVVNRDRYGVTSMDFVTESTTKYRTFTDVNKLMAWINKTEHDIECIQEVKHFADGSVEYQDFDF